MLAENSRPQSKWGENMVEKEELGQKLNDLERSESGSQQPTFPFDDPDEWEEAKGNAMVCEVIKCQKGIGKAGEYDIMEVKVLKPNFEPEAERLAVFVTGALKQEVISQEISEGDTIGVKYHGHIEADNPSGYIHDYTLDVYERSESGKVLYETEKAPF